MTTKKHVKGEYPKYVSDPDGNQIMHEGQPAIAQNEDDEKEILERHHKAHKAEHHAAHKHK